MDSVVAYFYSITKMTNDFTEIIYKSLRNWELHNNVTTDINKGCLISALISCTDLLLARGNNNALQFNLQANNTWKRN